VQADVEALTACNMTQSHAAVWYELCWCYFTDGIVASTIEKDGGSAVTRTRERAKMKNRMMSIVW